MMKAREQEADPMKFPRLVTMLALAFGAVEETAGEEVERVYRTNIFGLLHVWKNRSRYSSLERNKTMYKKSFIGEVALVTARGFPYEI
jgi:hypothetical protein